MRYLKTVSSCLLALALSSPVWAEIYETTDAEGNPEFSDAPTGANAEEINLQQTNIIDAPPAEPQDASQSDAMADEQAPVQENNTVIIHDGDGYDGYDDDLARERALERRELAEPGRVVDPGYEMPREVGDSNAEMPREVGDSDEMPRELGDSDALPREVGDAPAEHHGAHRR